MENEAKHIVDFEAAQLAPRLRIALQQLTEAYDYAVDTKREPWDFAIEMDRLLVLGLSTSDLRWLAGKGYVEHACEVTQLTDLSRRFRPAQNLAFAPQSCFIVTEAGMALVRRAAPTPAIYSMPGNSISAAVPGDLPLPATPVWDRQRRVLVIGGRVVKKFRVPSPNQEAVLVAFQREGWPVCVADPLPPTAAKFAKIRLHDTIKCLNARQENRLIRFRGNGMGNGVLWELMSIEEADLTSDRQIRRAA
jgi:hypothetical protein